MSVFTPEHLRGTGQRIITYDTFCTNAACAHSRRPHPVRGSVISYGGTIDPGSAGPETCPACDSELDTRPLYNADEPYVSESEDWT